MTEAQFRFISDLAHSDAGLVFPVSKAPLVRSRVLKRIRLLKLAGFDEYCDFVSSREGQRERRMLISSLTTNISSFYREKHHFDLLEKEVLPGLLDRVRRGNRLRIWSAGCSNGQEAYSIAMTIAGMDPGFATRDIKILATDIDPDVIATAKNGFYPENALKGIPENIRQNGLVAETRAGVAGAVIAPPLRAIISFRELNLLHDWPMKGLFDIIFCRNVVIYFDTETQVRLWQKFKEVTTPEGWLFVGHSERLSGPAEADFMAAGPTVYRRNNTKQD